MDVDTGQFARNWSCCSCGDCLDCGQISEHDPPQLGDGFPMLDSMPPPEADAMDLEVLDDVAPPIIKLHYFQRRLQIIPVEFCSLAATRPEIGRMTFDPAYRRVLLIRPAVIYPTCQIKTRSCSYDAYNTQINVDNDSVHTRRHNEGNGIKPMLALSPLDDLEAQQWEHPYGRWSSNNSRLSADDGCDCCENCCTNCPMIDEPGIAILE